MKTLGQMTESDAKILCEKGGLGNFKEFAKLSDDEVGITFHYGIDHQALIFGDGSMIFDTLTKETLPIEINPFQIVDTLRGMGYEVTTRPMNEL